MMKQQCINVMGEYGDLMSRRGEHFRARAYHSARDAISLYTEPLTSVDQLRGVKGVGKTIIAKLDEYMATGHIKALEQERANPLHVLTKVFGVGPKKAKALIEQGITTIEELRANEHLLPKASKIGLRYYEDIEARIPRTEIESYEVLLRKLIPESVHFAIVGSYRRGAADSGDIDVILTHPSPSVFQQIIDGLVERQVLVEVLSRGDVKCLGIGRLEGHRARRLDFLYAPPTEYAFATLYFTGSKTFNTIQRQRALDMGYSLNEHGLTVVDTGSTVAGEFPTEKSIFAFLQMAYLEPVERTAAVSPTPMKSDEVELTQLIQKANHAYYELGTPIMSDAEYDLLCSTTLKQYPSNKAASEGHTQCSVERNKATLPYEMWSMDKIKPDTDALHKWTSAYRGPYVLSAKLDGVSGLYTTEGTSPKLYTRGNGTVGQDISHLIPHMSLPTMDGIALRGEFIIKKSTFESKYATAFANARNFVAGLINQKHPDASVVADIDFVVYEVIRPAMPPSSQFDWLVRSRACVARHAVHSHITNEKLSSILLDWRGEYEYEVDGVICCQDAVHERVRGNPKHAFAFKMVLSEQMAESIVREVHWSPSKDGYLKPRVQLEPVVLGGATIEYATGFNGQFIQTHCVGAGAVIRLIRSGDVIPHIIDVVVPAKQPAMPDVPYIWNESGVDIMLADASNDSTVKLKNVTGFFRGIGVDGLSEGTAKRLIEAGYGTVPDIINMRYEDFLALPGFQKRMATKMHAGIRDRLAETSLPELMTATNLFGRGFGVKKFQAILAHHGAIDLTADQVSQVSGMADKSAQKYVEHLPQFLAWLTATGLEHKLNLPTVVQCAEEEDLPLKGKRFVMSGFRDKTLTATLIAKGAVQSSSVSKTTWALIVKDTADETGKVLDAKRNNVRIITSAEIKEFY